MTEVESHSCCCPCVDDLESQMSAMVSARDLTIRDLRAELAAERARCDALVAVAEAAERVCLVEEWDMTYRDTPDFIKGSEDEARGTRVAAITKVRACVSPTRTSGPERA